MISESSGLTGANLGSSGSFLTSPWATAVKIVPKGSIWAASFKNSEFGPF